MSFYISYIIIFFEANIVFVVPFMKDTTGRTMALGATQPLTEMSTRNVSWG